MITPGIILILRYLFISAPYLINEMAFMMWKFPDAPPRVILPLIEAGVGAD